MLVEIVSILHQYLQRVNVISHTMTCYKKWLLEEQKPESFTLKPHELMKTLNLHAHG